MRMFNMLLAAFIIDFALYFFLGSASVTTVLYDVMTNPSFGGFYGYLTLVLAGGAITMVTFGFLSKSENAPYYILGSSVIVFASSIINLWNQIASLSMFCGGEVSAKCAGAGIVATICVSPLLLLYLWTTIEFARGRD